ncbi:hypothetical protein [Massilia sp. DWR3-1-1]|uniref:hypothetical protein n=1 Tax=Massilia sp. DWR3-1-1 TaxID=2804559 RepID=UPI003CF95B10
MQKLKSSIAFHFSNKKLLSFLMIVGGFFIIDLIYTFLLECKTIQHQSYGVTFFGVLQKFSAWQILEKADYGLVHRIKIIAILLGAPLGIFLWILWPKFTLEEHQGWRRIYISVPILLGFILLLIGHDRDPASYVISTVLITTGVAIGGIFVMLLRWIFSGFEKKENG